MFGGYEENDDGSDGENDDGSDNNIYILNLDSFSWSEPNISGTKPQVSGWITRQLYKQNKV